MWKERYWIYWMQRQQFQFYLWGNGIIRLVAHGCISCLKAVANKQPQNSKCPCNVLCTVLSFFLRSYHKKRFRFRQNIWLKFTSERDNKIRLHFARVQHHTPFHSSKPLHSWQKYLLCMAAPRRNCFLLY